MIQNNNLEAGILLPSTCKNVASNAFMRVFLLSHNVGKITKRCSGWCSVPILYYEKHQMFWSPAVSSFQHTLCCNVLSSHWANREIPDFLKETLSCETSDYWDSILSRCAKDGLRKQRKQKKTDRIWRFEYKIFYYIFVLHLQSRWHILFIM